MPYNLNSVDAEVIKSCLISEVKETLEKNFLTTQEVTYEVITYPTFNGSHCCIVVFVELVWGKFRYKHSRSYSCLESFYGEEVLTDMMRVSVKELQEFLAGVTEDLREDLKELIASREESHWESSLKDRIRGYGKVYLLG